ncbi:hypothetical protein S40285_02528 [Stachybotrys chlorohalonatus IBT 40285]|uniref:Zn(2)-C6 fungal-type domain-containing protein n=1 Tax=Stachybotrys chlorohalonatus (strain IBT 40285) TaxID=1283841 RepID=A0A084QWN8_STAC4|nr:hypothetical protein S40285_02528 [Stachybotrys chlorohalonata IBT 40285]
MNVKSAAPSRHPTKHNACIPCRRKRANGHLPCDRCVSRGESCNYQDRVWRTKDDLRTEIANLQDSVAQVMSLLERLTLAQSSFKIEPDLVREVQQGTAFGNVMRMLGVEYHASENGFSVGKHTGGGLEPPASTASTASTAGASGSLPAQSAQSSPVGADETASPPTDPSKSGDVLDQSHAYRWHPATPPSIGTSPPTGLPIAAADQPWSGSNVGTSPPPPATQPSWATGPPPGEDSLNVRFSPASQQVASTQWGFLGIDIDEVHRAVGVYLEWELPGYSAICKEPFLEDLSTQRRRFCSEALVCAIMARAYQMMECDGDKTARESRIKRLYNQARALLIVERDALETMYPFIQTLTILASIEIVYNRMQEAWDLAFEAARLAILDALDHVGRPQASDEHLQVRANAFCGAVSLPRLMRLVLAKGEPLDAPLFMRLGTNSDETPESRIERGILLQRHFCALLPWCPARNAFTWQVTEQAHTYMMFHYNEGCLQQNKADLFEVYPMLTKCFEAWMARPENRDISPGMVYSQMQYHFNVMVVFQPYMNDRTLATSLRPREVLAASTQALVELAWSFKVNWGLERVHLGFPYILGMAMQVAVTLKDPNHATLEMGKAEGPRPRWAHSETACKGVMMLAELAEHHKVAQNFLAAVSRMHR